MHACYTWLLSLGCVILVVRCRRRMRFWDKQYDFSASEYTAILSGIPTHIIDPLIITSALEAQQLEVHAVHIAYDFAALLGSIRRLEQVEQSISQCEQAQERQFKPHICCRKVDLDQRLKSLHRRQSELQAEIEGHRQQPLQSTGTAFVTFGSKEAAASALLGSALGSVIANLHKEQQDSSGVTEAIAEWTGSGKAPEPE